MKDQWNQRYSSEEYVYGKTPNEFFKEELSKLAPGRILLPAEGEGRNAVFAATKGWSVFATDQSEEGRIKALALAEENHVSINYDLCDLMELASIEERFDVVALIFVHTPEAQRNQFHKMVVNLIKPGGLLILEGFSKEQLRFSSGGPKDASMLFSLEALKEDFADLDTVVLDHSFIFLDEGPLHQGPASVVRYIGRNRSGIPSGI